MTTISKEMMDMLYKEFRERLADDLLKSVNKAKLNHPGTLLIDEILEILKKGKF